PGAGTFWLVLKIPPGNGPGEKLVLDDASNAPSVVVGSSCGGGEAGISRAGRHEIQVPIHAAPPGRGRRGPLEPHFHPGETAPPRSAALETRAWPPGPPGAPAPPAPPSDSPTAPAGPGT